MSLTWLTKHCPVCGKVFEYLPNYTPSTCGGFSCVQEAVRLKIIPPSIPYSGMSYR